jgi:hypothetical protein
MTLEIFTLLWFIRIARYDIASHLIRNFDLVVLGLLVMPTNFANWPIGLLSFCIYLVINLLSGGKIGYGDIKLSFFCAVMLPSISALSIALTSTWMMAGLLALVYIKKSIPFAPFMILGTYFSKIVLYFG